ncbi:hypothetical protein BD779DRAFT_1623361 [Infundibulicybe gibba]|nr:hypothetical protein BD779DRAFT_1623361 [Infundibulicybe gibba]
MAPSTQPTHDQTMAHPAPNTAPAQASAAPTGVAPNMNSGDMSNVHLAGLDQNQILSLLRHLPGVFTKLSEQGKEDAAQTLSNLAQTQAPFAPQGPHHQLPIPHPYPGPQHGGGMPGINDPGPSSHPRGPPNLGQLSAVAMQAAPAGTRPQVQVQPQQQVQGQEVEEGPSDADDAAKNASSASNAQPPAHTSRPRRSATMGSDEWSRQRKDNHKEVERRRRGNINEGINELGRIVPNGSGEKAKGAILSRAVQYIHHLKENEARNIEKWTLEKLLMDQAMGDLQSQLDEFKRLWDEERMSRQRAESELEILKGGMQGVAGNNGSSNNGPAANRANSTGTTAPAVGATTPDTDSGGKRRNEGEGDPPLRMVRLSGMAKDKGRNNFIFHPTVRAACCPASQCFHHVLVSNALSFRQYF